MPRSKKAASRARGKGVHSSHGRRVTELAASFVPFAGANVGRGDDGNSLQSEAFHTQRHQSSWDSDQRLRHAKVMFVSAGDSGKSEPSEVAEPDIEMRLMTLNDNSEELRGDTHDSKMNAPLSQNELVTMQDDGPSGIVDETKDVFTIDTRGSDPVLTGLPPPQVRPISLTPSSSDEEVIVFAGRDKAGRGLTKLPKSDNKTTNICDFQIGLIEDKIHASQMLLAKNTDQAEQSSMAQLPAADGRPGLQRTSAQGTFTHDYQQPAVITPKTETAKGFSSNRARNHLSRKAKREQDQTLIDDYISNMKAQELDLSLSFNQRDLGGTDSDPWQETKTLSVDPLKVPSLNEWGRLELGDFDSMSTSDEILGSVQAILSKRNRKDGQQYLVIWEHHNVDEARWVPTSSLTDVDSMKLLSEFEAEKKLTVNTFSEGEDVDDSDTDDNSAHDEDDETSDDDIDLMQRKIDHMADEKIAKLLTKQEELGMGSSELILFDDSPEINLDEGDAKTHHVLKSTRRAFRKVPQISRAKGDFPPASALADAYDGFDVMNFERPSLKRRPKGRKGRLAINLSDSELEASMSLVSDKDRLRKRERKEERQYLRSQGLLGKKDTKPDLKAKYKEGMGIHAVKDEIKHFLMSDHTTLALSPMDKADRKVVHELANAFNLKSRSAGKGNNRFPVLYRTSRTFSFSEARFAALDSRLTRRYLPRMDLRERYSTSAPKRSGRGGISNGAVSYQDGDIVGGSAPELGIENKGRAMLEKMGWSTGTALGALNNKGILQPVSHIVKTTKAGLG